MMIIVTILITWSFPGITVTVRAGFWTENLRSIQGVFKHQKLSIQGVFHPAGNSAGFAKSVPNFKSALNP